MYSPEEIQAQKDDLRRAVLNARPFKPLYVKIKVFYGCNLKCEMCNHWRDTREPPVPADRFKEVLNELAELGSQKIHISGGEPMLRPQVPDFVEQASGLGIKVTMTTNGTLVDKVKAKRLVEGGLRGVNISLDSPIRKCPTENDMASNLEAYLPSTITCNVQNSAPASSITSPTRKANRCQL